MTRPGAGWRNLVPRWSPKLVIGSALILTITLFGLVGPLLVGDPDRIDNIDEQIFLPGAFASCAQMARFAHALWEEKLLNPAYTRLTLSPKVPGPPPPGPVALTVFTGYGPGATLAGEEWSYGHNGASSIGGVAEFVFYPDSGYVTVFLSNYDMDSIRGIPGLARKLIVEQG